MNRWAIIDDNGTIDEGTEDEVRECWTAYHGDSPPTTVWAGDLKLVEIHEVHR